MHDSAGQEPSPDVLLWVAEAIAPDATIQTIRRLKGATSSTLHAIDIEYGGRSASVVLRRFTNEAWLKLEPDLAVHEATSLQKTAEANLPAPRLIAYDAKGDICGVPAVLMSQLNGHVHLAPSDMNSWLVEMAEVLARIHDIDASDFPYRYFTYNEIGGLKPPQWSSYRAGWAKAIKLVRDSRPDSQESFIHRDYHPTNLLWQNGQISGIVDWVNSCRGWPGLDIGHCRLNLAGLHGPEVADRFLHVYQGISGGSFQYNPYWDLLVAIEILPGPPGVYPGWPDFGAKHLTDHLVCRRIDAYLESVVARL